MPFVERAGHRLHLEVLGAPDAPPLLLVMGLGMGSSAWHTLPARLAARFRVVLFDNRGTGRSTASRGLFRVRDLADDAAAVLDGAGVDRSFVFGISLGGMIALELALRHPERVRALALGATFADAWTSRKPAPRAALDLLVCTLARRRRARRMARLLVSDELWAREPARFEAWLAGLGVPPRATARRQLLAVALHATGRRLATVRAPTLVLTGDRDRVVPPENARRLASAIPGASLVVLRGAGHAFPFERADDTVRVLTEHFLGEAEGGGA